MTHTYTITGMTCGSCVARVKSAFLKMGDITEAEVQLAAPQATITMQKHVPTAVLQQALDFSGKYAIAEADSGMEHSGMAATESEKSWVATYKPVLLLGAYITLAAALAGGTAAGGFDWMRAMRIFMSGFFLSFSFFKMLNLKAFAESYAGYDIIAKRFPQWGYVYAFIELALGIAYAVNWNPFVTNLITLVVMSVSLVGVLQSVLAKRNIQCACLGAVFNLPMSTLTVIEDSAMILMSAAMLAFAV